VELVCYSEVASIPPFTVTPENDLLPWLAVYVKHRHEKNVATTLTGRGYESFLPLYRRVTRDSKKADLPLFPGYVFCRSGSKETLRIVSTPGVFSIVAFGTAPALVPDQEIDAIKRLDRSGLQPQPWPYLAPGLGQQVSLKAGPLRGIAGVVVENEHQKWIVISVHLLQRSVAVKVDREYL
jgi:transcription antitermination factor NusG